MRYLYTILLYLATPFIVLRLLWKSRKNPDYRQRWRERFGFFSLETHKPCLWVHAVSLGESITAAPLITALINQYPHVSIVITTTTPTGSHFIQKKFAHAVQHVYAPFDLPMSIRRFLHQFSPMMVVIMETELWPNVLFELKRYGIPVMIANARLSERSFKKYSRAKFFFKPLLQSVKMIAAQSIIDKKRFSALGISSKNIMITGNMKFDQTIPVHLLEKAKMLRQHWKYRPTWIAASTHQGEESLVLLAFEKIRLSFPNALLIIAPRHPERFQKVADLCIQAKHRIVRHSQNEIPQEEHAIYLADTMGKLPLLYGISDVAFVGGSLIPIGGHNLIEPAALSLPIISGPHLENFSAIRDLLAQDDALILVHNPDELAEKVSQLFAEEETRRGFGARAFKVSEKNRGAVAKHLCWIQTNMPT